jgi:hypothetical protein
VSRAVNDDGTFRGDEELRALYSGAGTDLSGKDVIVYRRIGERSAHTWFVLHELLDVCNVKNYDGSWVEYGSLVSRPRVESARRARPRRHPPAMSGLIDSPCSWNYRLGWNPRLVKGDACCSTPDPTTISLPLASVHSPPKASRSSVRDTSGTMLIMVTFALGRITND